MFGYLIPRSYKEALEFDQENNNTKWTDATRDEMDCIKGLGVFHHKIGFKPQTYPECTLQPPKDKSKIYICSYVQWQTHDKACGRWFSHPRTCGEHLLMSSIPEATLKTCDIPWGAQQLGTMGS